MGIRAKTSKWIVAGATNIQPRRDSVRARVIRHSSLACRQFLSFAEVVFVLSRKHVPSSKMIKTGKIISTAVISMLLNILNSTSASFNTAEAKKIVLMVHNTNPSQLLRIDRWGRPKTQMRIKEPSWAAATVGREKESGWWFDELRNATANRLIEARIIRNGVLIAAKE